MSKSKAFEIQVIGQQVFDVRDWRLGIASYLKLARGKPEEFLNRAKIGFCYMDGVEIFSAGIRLQNNGTYLPWADPNIDFDAQAATVPDVLALRVGCDQFEVESGLEQFIASSTLRALIIVNTRGGELQLRKDGKYLKIEARGTVSKNPIIVAMDAHDAARAAREAESKPIVN